MSEHSNSIASWLPRRVTTGADANAEARSGPTMSGVEAPAFSTSTGFSRTRRSRRLLSKRDVMMVVTQLSIMLRSGVDLAEAVRSVASQSASDSIREAMGQVYASLEGGNCLSRALDDQRDRFGGVLVASVAAGEASGQLPEVLARLKGIIRDELRLQSAIRSAVSYPLVLMGVTSLVLAAMVFFVLPQFAGIYAASRAPTPAITRILLDSADAARQKWWFILGTSGGVAVLAYRYIRSVGGRQKIDSLMLSLPLFRTVCSSLLTGRMFRLQGVMLASGVPMLEVLQLTRHSVSNVHFQRLIDAIQISVINGEGVAVALRRASCVPLGAAEMIATAETNGQLGEVLQTVGEFYESEGEQHLRDAVKIAEPAIIVGLGVVVGIVVLAVMLPLLDLSTAGRL